MAFESLRGQARSRSGGGSRNIALEVHRFDGEVVTGRDLETNETISVTLSADRTYNNRNPLSIYARGEGMIKKVIPGGVLLFAQVWEEKGVLAARDVKTVKVGPSDAVLVLTNVLARVGGQFQRKDSETWEQSAVVIGGDEAVAVNPGTVKAAALAALAADLPGRKGFVLRGISDGKAIAVRFGQPFEQVGEDFHPLDPESSWAKFLASDLVASGLTDDDGHSVSLSGEAIIGKIGEEGAWEIIPAVDAGFGRKTLEGLRKQGRDPSILFRFDSEKKGVGFVESIVAIGEDGDKYFLVAAVPTRSRATVFPMAYVPTVVAAPAVPALPATSESAGAGTGASGGGGGNGGGWEPPDDLDEEIPFLRTHDGSDRLLGKRSTWRI